MKGLLFPVMPLMHDETAVSFASRLARLHGVNLRQLCFDVGLKFAGLVAGPFRELKLLGEMTKTSLDRLRRSTFERLDTRAYVFGDEVLPASAVRHATTWV